MSLPATELMPEGSHIFPTKAAVEALYADMEALFSRAWGRFRRMTSAHFKDRIAQRRPAAVQRG